MYNFSDITSLMMDNGFGMCKAGFVGEGVLSTHLSKDVSAIQRGKVGIDVHITKKMQR